MAPIISRWPSSSVPSGASKMGQCIRYADKLGVIGLKVHSFSTFDRIKKYDNLHGIENAENTNCVEEGETKRTINLYASVSIKGNEG